MDEFGEQYDALCETFQKSTLTYSKSQCSNFTTWSESVEVQGVKYDTDKFQNRRFWVLGEKSQILNEIKNTVLDISHFTDSESGTKSWSDVSSYFKEKGTDTTYIIKADGGIEYTSSNATAIVRKFKANKFGYVENLTIWMDPDEDPYVFSVTYSGEPQ